MMRRNSGSSLTMISGAHTTCPGTPEYGDYRFSKGWTSERVPLTNGVRRHVTSTALMPFNSGRTLPSKWDDAERWITSPLSFAQPERRPKSKSGPLGPIGPHYSPTSYVKNYMANSPLTTGVFVAEGLSVHYESDARSSVSLYDENNNITRSVSVPDLLGESSPQDNGGKEEEEGEVSWRDVASQDDVRDVQMDNTATPYNNNMDPTNVQHLPSSSSDVANPSKTKLKREKAKIDAWENLQKAKAEAAIRKLEIKLEKKRSASMDKISNKLRAAHMKAEAMRNQSDRISPSRKGIMSYSLYFRICSLSSCFFCTNSD